MVRTLVTAVVTAAVLLGVGWLIVGRTADDNGAQASAAGQTTPVIPPSPGRAAASVGPEGVPLLGGAPLGPARSPAPGRSSGGIPCGSGEQVTYHVHARLAILIHGQ